MYKIRRWAALLGMALWMHTAVAAADYPDKPITMVVGFPAGQTTDIMSRLVAEALSKELGQTIIVENRPGQATSMALRHLKDQPADGYTMMLTTPAGLVINPHVYSDIRYDVFKDFDVAGLVAEMPLVLAAPATSPFATWQDVLAHAKSHPGELNFSSSGNGSLPHLGMVLLQKQAGVTMTHVPYKGSPRAMQDLSAARVDVGFDTLVVIGGLAQAGKLKILATTSNERLPSHPSVPTMIESGADKFTLTAWFMLVLPKGVDPAIIQRLNSAIKTMLDNPAFVERLSQTSAIPAYLNVNDSAAFLGAQYGLWKEVIATAGVKAD